MCIDLSDASTNDEIIFVSNLASEYVVLSSVDSTYQFKLLFCRWHMNMTKISCQQGIHQVIVLCLVMNAMHWVHVW